MLKVRATVEDVRIDPEHRDRHRRWLVSLRVDEILDGEGPQAGAQLRLLLHSPSRDLAMSDPVGEPIVVTLTDRVEDPYTGALEVGA